MNDHDTQESTHFGLSSFDKAVTQITKLFAVIPAAILLPDFECKTLETKFKRQSG
jgi:hypothetical protein